MSQPSLTALFHKLSKLAALSEQDERALLELPNRIERLSSRAYLVREGDLPKECCLLAEGFASRSRTAIDGGRQIVSFHIAGDMLDLQHLFLERADHDLQALTEATVLWIPMQPLRDLVSRRPAIATAFWREALIDASIFREWILNVGRRDAKTRIAHMLCEFTARCEVAGLGAPEHIVLPFSQEEIADATGMTPVHVNRMLRELTESGAIVRRKRALGITDWTKFRKLAGFDPSYLHLAGH